MGFWNPQTLGLLFLAAATIALSIALGITLAKDNNTTSNTNDPPKSEESPTSTTNEATPNAGGVPETDPGRPGLFGDQPSRGGTLDSIDLTATMLACPLTEGWSQPFMVTELANPSAVQLSLSAEGMLCTLTRISNPGGDGVRENTFLQPIGRSYGGHNWEKTRGKFVAETNFVCDASTSTCTIDLNQLEAKEGGGTYQLATFYDPAQYTKKDIVARFLEQATFGPSTATIAALEAAAGGDRDALKKSTALAQWIQDQQDETKHPVLSHRAIFRQRLNARFEHPSNLGRTSLPCEAGARYRRMTFSEKDKNKKLTLTTSADGTTKLFQVDGVVRTASSTLAMWQDEIVTSLWYPDGDYKICDVKTDQYEGLSEVQVKHPDHNKCVTLVVQATDGQYYSNPPIQVHAGANTAMLAIPAGSAQEIDGAYSAKQPALVADSINNPEVPQIILTAPLTDAACEALSTNAGSGDQAVIAEWNGNHYLFDPRFHLLDNTPNAPLADGGGAVAKEFGSLLGDGFSAMCSNAPRTFVNQDTCFLSSDPNVCSYRPTSQANRNVELELGEESEFLVTLDKLQQVYQLTGAGEEGTIYLYAIDGLDVIEDQTVIPPCQRVDNSYSRWIVQDCVNPGDGLGQDTIDFFEKRLAQQQKKNTNEQFLDYWFPKRLLGSCDPADELKKGYEIRNTLEDDKCFKNVHPDNLNVYDFTYWVDSHPGNTDGDNKISWFAENEQGKLMFPASHEIGRWHQQKSRLRPQRLRLGTMFDFYSLPQTLRTQEVATALGVGLSNQAVEEPDVPLGPTMVCGSPGEVANDPSLGGNSGGSVPLGAFDVVTSEYSTSTRGVRNAQRSHSWLIAAMADPGQLRQRVAWALSQIFAITPIAIRGGKDTTEMFLNYYDIFVWNAFGNYRDVMKEVSYSPLMAEMLTYYGGRSTAVTMEDEGNVEFADENYAREIMQLFSIGLYTLNPDGTQLLDAQGATKNVYTNDDIEEYARAWTGFIRQPRRGNFEELYRLNQIDPMQIFAPWRDRLPKMGLNRQYVGDGYPLCSDLPRQHFLAQGSTYQLVDSPTPELHMDPIEWRSETPLTLDANSQLYAQLSAGAPKLKVVLDQTLACTGAECSVDAVRTLKVGDYYYEYIRTPCVNQAFYSDPKTIARRLQGDHAMCANPMVESATAACCGGGETWSEQFFGERMLYTTASERCSATLCGLDKQPACTGNQCLAKNYYWTSSACTLKAKIDKASGKVGIVHGPSGVADDAVAPIVQSNTQTFFRVDWDGDFAAELAACETLSSCSLTQDGMCLCDVTVLDEQVFSGTTPPIRQDVLNSLAIGAVDPDPSAVLQGEEVVIYNAGADGSLTADSVFAVLDAAGQRVLRKNAKSRVTVLPALSFRNPVHFMSLSDAEPRDAHQETDATLDHYFYHSNTAPFVAYRFAQRFGLSNPSPRYTEEIANAFTSGTYAYEGTSFGSGEYGDLAATFAAVLLDREARDFVLDSDPSHGSLKEPVQKFVGLMRALDFQLNDIFNWVGIRGNVGERIGQMAHEIPSVFSFFLPEYQASGPVSQGDLVSPEAQVLTGPRIIETMNGFLSMLKYGLNQCSQGFGPTGFGKYCGTGALIGAKIGVGGTSFTPSTADASTAVSELATLLTAGRLSPYTRTIVQDAYAAKADENAIIRAQMLISATPEFHATSLSLPSGVNRAEIPDPTFSEQPYKAIVYLQLTGGYDSFNVLVPQSCTATNAAGRTLVEQYEFERTTIGLTEEERALRVIDAANQACEQFAIHPEMEILERLYNEGDLTFFANAGQLDAPVTKDDYYFNTRSKLFAHNTMQEEGQRIDPWDTAPGTGILGRMCDVLKLKGFIPQPITVQDATVATVGVPGSSVPPLVAALGGPQEFAPYKRSDGLDLREYVASLNNATQLHSSVFGETWSVNFQRAIEDSEQLEEAIDQVELTQEYPDDEDGQQYRRTARVLSELILTRGDRGADRDVIFAQLGGWDMHADVKEGLSTELRGLNEHLTLFESEMKAQGLWDSVTVVVTSDFGRTLTANSGEGSDHAWGGHYFMLGGAVNGGQILGTYPPDISVDGPVNIGRGRIMPTSSWESIFAGPLQWMGLDTDADLDYCMPNRLNTGAPLFTADQSFKQARRSLRRSEQTRKSGP